MGETFEMLQQATEGELRDIMKAIEKRYAAVYPDWEVLYVAIHKDPALRRAELKQVIAYLEKDIAGSSEKNGLP